MKKIWIIAIILLAVGGLIWWWKSGQKDKPKDSSSSDKISLSFVSADWKAGQAQVDVHINGKKYPIGIQYNLDLSGVQVDKTSYYYTIAHDRTPNEEATKVTLLDSSSKTMDEVTIDWVIQSAANTRPTGIENNQEASQDYTLIR